MPAVLAGRRASDYPAFREQLRREMTIDALRQRDVLARIAVSEREISRWLEQHDATRGSQVDYDISQILIPLPEIRRHSNWRGTGARRGDPRATGGGRGFCRARRGRIIRPAGPDRRAPGLAAGSQLPRNLRPPSRRSPTGEFSAPVRSSSGFHIFRVNATRGGDERVVELQTKARHICSCRTRVLDDDDDSRAAEAIRERVLNGESFADIAMLESEDPGLGDRVAAISAGIRRGIFVPEFEAQLEQLSRARSASLSGRPYGWHIISWRIGRSATRPTKSCAHAGGPGDTRQQAGAGDRALAATAAGRSLGRDSSAAELQPRNHEALPAMALTVGEPAGIGPELCLAIAARPWPARLAAIGPLEHLRDARPTPRAQGHAARGNRTRRPHRAGELQVIDVPLAAPVPGPAGSAQRRRRAGDAGTRGARLP
jgi:hypothetical protein